jgi:hypothetical protein
MRRRILTSLLTIAATFQAGALISTSGCSGGEIAVGRTDQTSQALEKKTDGSATGNGQICSWEGTVFAANANASTSSYAVGASFPSPDGCNTCNCSPEGILCTIEACPTPTPCPALAKACADGSTVSPTGPNCEFPACPPGPPTPAPVPCPAFAIDCALGSHPDPEKDANGCPVPKCVPDPTPAPCPAFGIECVVGTHPDTQTKDANGCPVPQCVPDACPAIAKVCPDGSTVTASGPNCTIPDCPCTTAECGPVLGMPNYLCPDGKTVAGPGPCARTNGVCSYTIVSCPAAP